MHGSVRAEIAADTDITAMGAYQPYGVPTDVEGAYSQSFRFTGEMLDSNALQYHRVRYYGAGAAQWASLDLFWS
jgi:RHS repeat-associated protein